MTATDWCARAKGVMSGKTAGPWWHYGSWPFEIHGLNGEQILVAGRNGSEVDTHAATESRNMLPAAVAAIEAVLAILGRDGPEVTGPEHDDWVWLDDAQKRISDIEAALAALLDPS